MKRVVLLSLLLVLGVIAGAVGARELCMRGHCGNEVQEGNETSASAMRGTFAAGALEDAISTSTSSSTMTCGDQAGAAASGSTANTSTRFGIARRCQSNEITGLAIIGDSTADEYRADNPRGGDFGATTFNWVELLANERGVNLGEWDDRPEPRRSGYAFNWARSGATSETMIGAGQHAGVAEQVQVGDVSHVIIQIGINDFYYNDVALRIYDGTLAGPDLEQFIDRIVTNADTAVRAVREAGATNVILAATQDYLTAEALPDIHVIFPDPGGLQRVTDAIASVNEGLSAAAASNGAVFFDFNAALQSEIEARIDPNDPRFIVVDGAPIDRSTKGDEPHHLFLDDDYAHPGTVFSGLIANLFIDEMNCAFGARIDSFSDVELLQIAGVE